MSTMGEETKSIPDLLPNQVERMEFSLEQIRELSSPVRSAVFWSFHAYIRKSVNDIAKELGKSAQTVHYHVNELLKLEMIVPAETRKRRSRTEQLYVRKGRVSIDPMVGVTEEYNRYRVRGVKFDTQKIYRETSYFFGLLEHDASIRDFAMWRKFHLMLTRERAVKLKEDMAKLLVEASLEQTPAEAGGIQVNAVGYMKPTLFQLKTWAEEAKIPFEELSREGITDPSDDAD